MGCRYCMLACPFQAPVYEWSKTLPRVKKCNMCYERLQAGKPTACSEACPTGATITGGREELIREARRRIAENPQQYHNRVYGLREAGGTSVLMIASVPLEQLGMSARLPQEPLPMLTWRVLSFVPDLVGAGSVLLGGVYWITHRREQVAEAERNQPGKGKQR
jgi:formate dehydrogenase iron-sulfur subunit